MPRRSSSDEQLGFSFGEGTERGDADPVERRCGHCRRIVEVPGWFAAQGVDLYFCSRECRQAWIAETPSFEVTLEKRYRPRGANWEIQARAARQRDGFACQVCRITEEELGRQLDVHHKIPFRSFKSNVEANRLENLISVCPSCHAKLEAELREDLPLFRKP